MLILPIVVIYKCKLENSASLNTLLKCESNEFIKEIFVYNNSLVKYLYRTIIWG